MTETPEPTARPTWGDVRAKKDPEWAAQQAVRVDPEEPPVGTVLRFHKMRFASPTAPEGYSYAALRAKDMWYLTNGQRYFWPELIDFIQEREPEPVTVEQWKPTTSND